MMLPVEKGQRYFQSVNQKIKVMRKIVLLILSLIMTGCGSTKLPIDNKTIIVKSNSSYKEKLKRYCIIQSNTLYGCELHINFINKELEKNKFSISVLKKEQNVDLYVESNSTLISKNKQENYITKIYSVNPKDEEKSSYSSDYKLILIYKIENGYVYLLQNDSKFEENVSELFLLERFKELTFTIKDKKMMKKLHRTL